MKYLGILAWIILPATFTLAAAPTYTASLKAAMQQYPSVAEADIDASLVAGGSVDQVAVRAAGDSSRLLPARLEQGQGTYRVLWQVPAAQSSKEVGKEEEFAITLQPKGAGPASPGLSDKQANLIYNGDFERIDPTGAPGGIWNPNYFKAYLRLAQEGGGHFLQFNVVPDKEKPVYHTPRLAVNGGESYTVSFRYRVKDAQPDPRWRLTLYSYVYFYGADGKPLNPARATGLQERADTNGWQTYQTVMLMPKEARFALLELHDGSTVPFSVSFDDVRLAPATGQQVLQLKTGQDNAVSLGVAGADIRRFDLGPDGQQVWPGYTSLTPASKYAPQAGFGFTTLVKPRAIDTTRPDALARDFISADQADLRVDLPSGKYHVWLLSGDSQTGWTVLRLYFDQSFKINGREMIQPGQSPREYFSPSGDFYRNYRAFWTPQTDFYQIEVAAHFKMRDFSADVMNDHLDLSWSNLPVDAIVIAPEHQLDAMRSEMTTLESRRRRATRIIQTPDPVEPMPEISPRQQDRGFVLFRRPANEWIYPSSRPKQSEEVDHLQTFAAPGQVQAVHFSLLPLKDLGAVNVTASALADGDSIIPADDVDVRVVRYMFHSVSGSTDASPRATGGYLYQVAPYVLDHHGDIPGDKGVTWSWWANIRVPPNARPGVYSGSLAIRSRNAATFNLPINLRVVPFKPAALPIVQGYYYTPGEPWHSTFIGNNVNGPSYRDDPAIREIIVRNETRELAFMKDLGLNSVALHDDLRGDWVYRDGRITLKKDSRFILWMDLYAKAGMGPMPFYGFHAAGQADYLRQWFGLKPQFSPQWTEAYRSIVENLDAMGRQRGWPEILWYTSDEASNHGKAGAEVAIKCAEALAGMKGVRTIASMDGPPEHVLPAHVSISMPNIAFPINPETIRMIKDSGSEFWMYNVSNQRLMLGLYPWRVGAGGRFQWIYWDLIADPWDDLDGRYGEMVYSLALPGPDGPVETLRGATLRAAIMDHRYAATLDQAIAAARKDPSAREALTAAEKFLVDLRARIPVDPRVLTGPFPAANAIAPISGEYENTDALDRVRWAMARFIMELKKER